MAQLLVKRLRWKPILRIRFNTTVAAKQEPLVPEPSPTSKKQQQADSGKTARAYLSGGTIAILATIGVLHAKRMYDDKKMELAIQQGYEPEFAPDKKARFLQLLPLRSISRVWGSITSVNLPTWSRPVVYKAWARAFHTDLEDVPLPLEEYASLRDFFSRGLKEGVRPIDTHENSLLSPVDGVVVRYGCVTQPGAKVEQVKGFTYSVASLLGAEPHIMKDPVVTKPDEEPKKKSSRSIFNFWRSQPSIDVKAPKVPSPPRELFYCVLYLGPGDYHRVHSPSNWCIGTRRHMPGDLYPVNARATRTIQNLYVLNERVVLQGDWKEGFMAMALVGATNIGSIELKHEPELKTNRADVIEVNIKDNCGYCIRKGDEVATFNMGSTVVMVFEAPGNVQNLFGVLEDPYQGFKFTVQKGQRIRMGQAIGQY